MFKTEQAYKLAKESGWTDYRKVDKEVIIQEILNEGYPIIEKAVEFLESFWNIVIYFVNRKNGIQEDDINFNFNHASNLEVPERLLKDYEPRIGKKVCLIGSAYRDHFILMMADDGSVYGGYDSFLCKIADNGYEAIEAIILDKPFIEL